MFSNSIITRQYYYREEKGSAFGQGKHKYSLNKIFKKIEYDDRPTRSVGVRKLLWGIRKSDLDPERIKKANPDVPIVVEHYRGRIVVVDGAHRLMKAKEMGRKEIDVRFVTQKELGDAETRAKGTTKDRSDRSSGTTKDRSSDPGVMIALHLPVGVAGRLALRGVDGAESPSTFHVTLAYLGRISSLGSDPARVLAKVGSILRDVGKASKRLSGSVGGVGRFSGSASSDNKDVIYAGVDVPGLVELRHRICEGLKAAGITYSKDHGFTPHITLAYVDEKAKTPVLRIPSAPVAFNSISLTSGDVQNDFPLSGSIDYARRSRPDMNETIGQRLRRRVFYSAAHAPAGGVSVAGKEFTGGEFIPAKVMARATSKEKSEVKGKGAAEVKAEAPKATARVKAEGKAKTEATPAKPPPRPKIAATPSELVAVKRTGTGKDATLTLADGGPAPSHIKPGMVPSEWTNVVVSKSPDSDILVKGRDKAGRLQTVYSDNFAMRTAAAKFSRVHEMMSKSSEISSENQANRTSPNPAVRDAADLTWLIEEQGTRPGSASDTKAKVKAFGATTLRAEHVIDKGPDGVRLQFVGKEGVHHDHLVRNPELAKMLLERKESAGSRNGQLFSTNESKLNKYIATLDGGSFSAKDFRTLKANKLAIEHINFIGKCCDSVKDYKSKVKEVAVRVSNVLGNKPSQALLSYINPSVFSVWSKPANG